MMDYTLQFYTDVATLAVFDPVQLQHRAEDDYDWWCVDATKLDEVRRGAVAIIGLGGDGIYKARITDGNLTPDERDYASEVVHLGVEVVSGHLFVGPGECLPGGGFDLTPQDVERGAILKAGDGAYAVEAYAIDWFNSPRWWTEDGRGCPGAPADFVIVLRPRHEPFAGVTGGARFNLSDDFLFESSTREIGPQLGMILTTTVRKGSGKLQLKDCGPGDYQASLVDYSAVKWKDRIRFRVVSVDHAARTMTGEVVEILN
jgi:hypothetical protein